MTKCSITRRVHLSAHLLCINITASILILLRAILKNFRDYGRTRDVHARCMIEPKRLNALKQYLFICLSQRLTLSVATMPVVFQAWPKQIEVSCLRGENAVRATHALTTLLLTTCGLYLLRLQASCVCFGALLRASTGVPCCCCQ